MSSDPPDDLGIGSLDFDPEAFSGVVRLFPLPAPSLFPRVVQPLHVFEERYRALMRDALDSDGLIAMAVLRPGWEPDYASRPPLEPVACLGQIVTHHELEDGRFNLLLAGVGRVRLLEEIEPPQVYRSARAELIEEVEPSLADAMAIASRRRLAQAFRSALPHGEPPEALLQVFEDDTPLGLLADLAAYTLPLSRELKQAVLTEPDAVLRAALLLDELPSGEGSGPASGGSPSSDGPGLPPPFSLN